LFFLIFFSQEFGRHVVQGVSRNGQLLTDFKPYLVCNADIKFLDLNSFECNRFQLIQGPIPREADSVIWGRAPKKSIDLSRDEQCKEKEMECGWYLHCPDNGVGLQQPLVRFPVATGYSHPRHGCYLKGVLLAKL
jgi:hypothetical protein